MPFIDWGYEEDPKMGIPLPAAEEPNRYGIQLYHATASQWDIAGKKVLEVSCGHGGGAEYLATTMKPAAYTGLDINAPGVEFCRKTAGSRTSTSSAATPRNCRCRAKPTTPSSTSRPATCITTSAHSCPR